MNTSLGFLRLGLCGALFAALVLFLPAALEAQPAITSVSSTLGVVGNAFSYQIEASGTPTSYAATGLPPGLSVNAATGLISGTTAMAGIYEIELSATNADGTDTASLSLTMGIMGTTVAISGPRYLAFDGDGNLAVSGSGKIVRVAPNGISSILAFDSSAQWNGLAYDSAGNLYASDNLFGDLMKFSPEGEVDTLAIGAVDTEGIAIDGAGNIYFARGLDDTIGKVTPEGVVSTFASGTDFVFPAGIAFDPSGNLFVANFDSGTVVKVAPDGTVTPFASGFGSLWGLACDAAGTVYVSSYLDGIIYKITPEGSVSPLVTGLAAFGPVGLTFDQAGALYVANVSTHVVIRIGAPLTEAPEIGSVRSARGVMDNLFSFQIEASGAPSSFAAVGLPAGLSVDTTTGKISGTPTESGVFSVGLSATNSAGIGTATLTLSIGTRETFVSGPLVESPSGLAFDPAGNLMIGVSNGTIVKVTPAGDASVFVADIGHPSALAYDSSGNLYAAHFESGNVSKITPAGMVTVFATGFSRPRGLAFDCEGNLYVSQSIPPAIESEYRGLIGKVTPDGVVSTFATNFPEPLVGLAFDKDGNLYASSQTRIGGSSIVKIAPDGARSTFAAPFTYSNNIAFDCTGTLYVSESVNGLGLGAINQVTTTGSVGAFLDHYDTLTPPAHYSGLAFDDADNLYVGTSTGIDRVIFPASPPVITSETVACGTYGERFCYTIEATNCPTEFAAEGLPRGLYLNPVNGKIWGTPWKAGLFWVDIGAGNSAGTGFAVLKLKIAKARAVITLGDLKQSYDGLPKPVSVTTNPTGLPVKLTYDGSVYPPTEIGTYEVRATVVSPNYTGWTCGTLRIEDCTSPVIKKLKASPSVLWPTNHKLVTVTVSAKAWDNVGVTSLKIVKVTSSEPDSGLGGGDVASDIRITGDLTVKLRAECGRGEGRIYTIKVMACDAAGNKTVETLCITVPKSAATVGGKGAKGGKDRDWDFIRW